MVVTVSWCRGGAHKVGKIFTKDYFQILQPHLKWAVRKNFLCQQENGPEQKEMLVFEWVKWANIEILLSPVEVKQPV